MSDFEEDLAKGSKFWLGPIKQTHHIGNFDIIEYQKMEIATSELTAGTGFTGYLNGNRIGLAGNSLNEMLVYLICISMEPDDFNLPSYVWRLIVGPDRPQV